MIAAIAACINCSCSRRLVVARARSILSSYLWTFPRYCLSLWSALAPGFWGAGCGLGLGVRGVRGDRAQRLPLASLLPLAPTGGGDELDELG